MGVNGKAERLAPSVMLLLTVSIQERTLARWVMRVR
jgi:hypothetical protein